MRARLRKGRIELVPSRKQIVSLRWFIAFFVLFLGFMTWKQFLCGVIWFIFLIGWILIVLLVSLTIPLMAFDPSKKTVFINHGRFFAKVKEYEGVPEFRVEPGTDDRGREIWQLYVQIGDNLIHLTAASLRTSVDRLAQELRDMVQRETQPRVTP